MYFWRTEKIRNMKITLSTVLNWALATIMKGLVNKQENLEIQVTIDIIHFTTESAWILWWVLHFMKTYGHLISNEEQ